MLKRYHEAPLSIFDHVQTRTDGDYALVHLFDSNEDYYEKFKQAVAKGRDVILDNSLFELGEAFDAKKFNNYIDALKPRYYIVPDSWRNGKQTVRMFEDFVERFPRPIEGRVGVAQGKTFEEVAATYRAIAPFCEMIAFNFDFSGYYYAECGDNRDVREAMSIGRIAMLQRLQDYGVIDTTKKHHLLGCGVPQEMKIVQQYPWITSIDTCHPIMTGMMGFKYTENGFSPKCQFKMCDFMDYVLGEDDIRFVEHNLDVIESWLKED